MSTPAEMPEMELAHVLFMDVVGYSKLLIDEQVAVINELKQAVAETAEYCAACSQKTLVCMHTGDGMALAFFGSPEGPVRCALEIARALKGHARIKLRMGVNSGPVYRIPDLKGEPNVAGGGINFAQRVMDCGDGGHILLSASIADVLRQHGYWAPLIRELGVAEVKHRERVGIFNLYTGVVGNPAMPEKLAAQFASSASTPSAKPSAVPVSGARIPILEPPSAEVEYKRPRAPRRKSRALRWAVMAVILALVVASTIVNFPSLGDFLFPPSDAAIAQSIRGRFSADPNLRQCRIEVVCQNGVVTLTGWINQRSDKDVAARIAGQQAGVKQVNVFGLLLLAEGAQNPQAGGNEIAGNYPPLPAPAAPAARAPAGSLSRGTDSSGSHSTDSGLPKTVIVLGNQPWTDTGLDLSAGDAISVDATGNISFSTGGAGVGPDGDQPSCAVNWKPRVPYVAQTLRCHSLIGRIGASGAMFEAGSTMRFRASTSGRLYLGVNDNFFPDNSGSWTAKITVPSGSPSANDMGGLQRSATGPNIATAVIRRGSTSIQLPPGQMYLYGMVTGGGFPASAFAQGQYAQAINAAGNLSAALAYGTSQANSYVTQTEYHDIGGVCVVGAWDKFTAYHGVSSQIGAPGTSVSFDVTEDSLVVILGMASSQQSVELHGLSGLQVDAGGAGNTMVIAHAHMTPGTYTVGLQSRALAAGQDPTHMTDLVGVFVFGWKRQ